MKTEKVEGLLVDIEGAAQVLGISVPRVRRAIKDGGLPVITIGRRFYFQKSSLARWAQKSEARA